MWSCDGNVPDHGKSRRPAASCSTESINNSFFHIASSMSFFFVTEYKGIKRYAMGIKGVGIIY